VIAPKLKAGIIVKPVELEILPFHVQMPVSSIVKFAIADKVGNADAFNAAVQSKLLFSR